jgi:hypothetical protein
MADAGLLQLRFLQHLRLAVSSARDCQRTSFCTVPNGLSQLSTLHSLSLGRYCNHIEAEALLHLTGLQRLYMYDNPAKDPADAEWLHHLPSSLKHLTVSGAFPIVGKPPRGARPVETVPCITGLSQLEKVSLRYLKGFRIGEWNAASCLAGLSCLRDLDLSACGVRQVPVAIVGLQSLTKLCLRSNRLQVLPVGPYLQHLKELNLVDNKFACVPLEAVQAATALTCLSMGGNPLVLTAAEAEAVKHIKVFKAV